MSAFHCSLTGLDVDGHPCRDVEPKPGSPAVQALGIEGLARSPRVVHGGTCFLFTSYMVYLLACIFLYIGCYEGYNTFILLWPLLNSII